VLRASFGAGLALGFFILSGDAPLLCPDIEVRPCPAAGRCLLTYKAEPRPDLTVSMKASTPSKPRQDVSLSTTVKNIGAGAAPPSSCDVIIRNARPPRQQLRRYGEAIPALDPGGSYTFTITVKPGFGAYEVCAVADPKNLIVESDETNNQSCETVMGK
jgi:subtilase family serine protease